MKAWWLVVLGVPFLGYVLPALVQSYLGRGADSWKATLASKYVERTGAEPSADNPRHLRWPVELEHRV